MIIFLKQWFKAHIKFNWKQIPIILFFAITSFCCFLPFSNSRTAHTESLASTIADVSNKASNKQLTFDFYYSECPSDVNITSFLSKTITETKSFNRDKYIYYRGNGHKVRVVSNGEGTRKYWFPDLPINPSIIVENTFGTAWGEDYLYENYSLYLLNKENKYFESKREKHFFINESDANYLINNNPSFYNLKLEDVPGHTLTMHYFENGEEKEEEWMIANVVRSNQLDDNLYKKLYTSYIISDYHLPALDISSFSIAFDFTNSEIDNCKLVSDAIARYLNCYLKFDTRNISNASTSDSIADALLTIKNGFYGLSNYNDTGVVSFCIFIGVIAIMDIFLYFYCSFVKAHTFSSCLTAVIVCLLTYSFFFFGSLLIGSTFFTRSFNSLSIIALLLLLLSSSTFIYLASPKEMPENSEESKG